MRTRHGGPPRRFVALLLLAWLCAVGAETLDARSYALDRVVVNATVEPDGSLLIEETRTYTYDGRYSWADFRLPLDRVWTISEFSLSEGGRAFTSAVADAPGTYRLETSAEEMYVRWNYDAEDESRSFTLRYRVSDAVDVHADVAELYYQFIGEINPQPIGGVEVRLTLPQTGGFDEVRAWAHGPLHGLVTPQPSGRVTFNVAPLPAGQMWEARVTFPRA